MFISLNENSPIIGMDYSYSDEKHKKVSIYFKSMNSMIVDPSFLEVMAMMNGVFDRKSILSYAYNAHSYDKSYVSNIFNEMISWGVATEVNSVCLWGESFDKEYSTDTFSRFDVRFLSATPALIDLALLLCKYSFNSISFSDSEIKIKQEDVDSSVLLQESDVGRLLSDMIAVRRNNDRSSIESGHETIYMCDGCADICSGDCDILMDANDYRNNNRFCKGIAFRMSGGGKQNDSQFIEFEHTLKMESDVIFGVIDGFFD